MAKTTVSPNTGTSLATMSPGAQRKLWKKGADIYEQTHDFFMQMEGKARRSIIVTETDTSKGKGQKMTFTNMSGFYSEGRSGEEQFEDSANFEELLINDYELTVDFIRNATRWTARTEEWMGMRGELKNQLPYQLGEWMGRMKTERLFMMFNKKGASDNYVFANGKAGKDSLVSADVLDYDEIVVMGTQMKRLGGKPAIAGKTRNGVPIFRNCVVATSDALFSLEMDSSYKQVLREAGNRGEGNYIFEGGYTDVRGHVIKEYVPIDHDGDGPVGSPINPKAFLGEAVTAGTTTFDIKGGGSAVAAAKTAIKYFKWFPRYAYKWLPSDTYDIAGDAATFHVLIVNPPSGTDANKIGMYECTVNDGNKITVSKRLGSAIAGIRHTTVGDVVWNTGVWEGKHTDVHPIGATIVLCNSKGVPIGNTLMLGAGAAIRGYGMYRNHRSQEQHEGGFVNDTFITSVFGQEPRKDRKNRCPGFMHLTHAVQYAGLPIPNNIT
jgi:hypothetical protein